MLLVHSSPTTLAPYRHPNLGVLGSPRRFYLELDGWKWALDNDAFSEWNDERYLAMLDVAAQLNLDDCLFVTAPDVVGDWRETHERFGDWLGLLSDAGVPIAYVIQDGQPLDAVPWSELDAVFVGGTTGWKLGEPAALIVREAKDRGKWVHMGRVNSYQRVKYAKAIGCDSADGTQFSWFRDRWLRPFLDAAAAPVQMMLE